MIAAAHRIAPRRLRGLGARPINIDDGGPVDFWGGTVPIVYRPLDSTPVASSPAIVNASGAPAASVVTTTAPTTGGTISARTGVITNTPAQSQATTTAPTADASTTPVDSGSPFSGPIQIGNAVIDKSWLWMFSGAAVLLLILGGHH